MEWKQTTWSKTSNKTKWKWVLCIFFFIFFRKKKKSSTLVTHVSLQEIKGFTQGTPTCCRWTPEQRIKYAVINQSSAASSAQQGCGCAEEQWDRTAPTSPSLNLHSQTQDVLVNRAMYWAVFITCSLKKKNCRLSLFTTCCVSALFDRSGDDTVYLAVK